MIYFTGAEAPGKRRSPFRAGGGSNHVFFMSLCFFFAFLYFSMLCFSLLLFAYLKFVFFSRLSLGIYLSSFRPFIVMMLIKTLQTFTLRAVNYPY